MKIAIVNDLLIAVEALRRVITTVPEYEIIWVAQDGTEAVAKAVANPPDLILMDLLMSQMNGVEATRRIMLQSPCAILLVTATVSGHGAMVFEAMGYGALDAVNTPILGSHGQSESGAEVLEKIATIGRLIGKLKRSSQRNTSQQYPTAVKSLPPLIVIGASTGGPIALKTLLSQLPADFPAAIVIIQHIDVQFAPGLVAWLDQQVSIHVQVARDGSQIEAGKVLIASTNHHLVMQSDQTLTYTTEPRNCSYHPSVDVFFKSAAQHWDGKGIGILLTGMGRDGAEGLLALRAAGWHTIAQDQDSCVVYGMPKAAVEIGAAIEVLPIEAIASECIKPIQKLEQTVDKAHRHSVGWDSSVNSTTTLQECSFNCLQVNKSMNA